MKTIKPLATLLFTVVTSLTAFSQNNAESLIQQGVTLNDQGKYAEAIEKYNEALKVDPNSLHADFEMGYTLFTSGKGKEAIPYMEKVVQSKNQMVGGAYDMLGSIYDDDKQYDKAIEMYTAGIKADPKYQRLYYNLSVSYTRQKKFAEAEANAIAAIKLDPTHASSRLSYAMACYGQNKRVPAIMGLCDFLLMETNTQRSANAYNVLKNLIKSGITKTDDTHTSINLNMQKDGDDDLNAAELSISLAVLSVSNDSKSKNLSPTETLQAELKAIFGMVGEISARKKNKDFFWTFYADYFYLLSKSDHMPVLTHIVALNENRDENLKWLKDNTAQLTSFQAWMKSTPRAF